VLNRILSVFIRNFGVSYIQRVSFERPGNFPTLLSRCLCVDRYIGGLSMEIIRR